jgi:hypothetical protein
MAKNKKEKPTIEFVANYVLDQIINKELPIEVKTPMGFLPEDQIKYLSRKGYKIEIITQDIKGTLYKLCK